MSLIHPTAIVDPQAELHPTAVVGAYSVIAGEVVIGAGTEIGSHVYIDRYTRIGRDCRIYPFASVGTPPQDKKFKGEKTELIIGDENVIREYVTINRGTPDGGGVTVIGNQNLLLAYVHVAHDCHLGNGITMVNVATLGGHVTLEDHAVIGGLSAVHQFVRIGAHAYVGGKTGVSQDIPPFVLASGERAKLFGLNIVGLKRYNFSNEAILALKKAYQTVIRSHLTIQDAMLKVEKEVPLLPEVSQFLDFIRRSQRGIPRR
ncbi:MAG: acyl-ACP--UDP-N-acetylglucosamine O-acyltransferase [Desulfobacterota bacterium]|jgi:UDP-N-acetylglucosamine acyltransferase|nr:acyl-ACP--UDP-N-acetylglucosamine O-acyltransferase [Thermodesulfobacteriota bacterium]